MEKLGEQPVLYELQAPSMLNALSFNVLNALCKRKKNTEIIVNILAANTDVNKS